MFGHNIFVCNIISHRTYLIFVRNISSDITVCFVCNVCSNARKFGHDKISYVICLDTRHNIFLFNIRSDITHFPA